MIYYDPTIILLVPAMILSICSQLKINSAYSKYSKVRTESGHTGAETAREILDRNGLSSVRIEKIAGKMSDHYDPGSRVLRLSYEVYDGKTIASNAIAAHEVGHAIQHAKGYSPMTFRDSMVPVVNISSRASLPIFLMGMLFSMGFLLDVGIILFSVAVLFHIVTLPVEFNASRRAIAALEDNGILSDKEIYPGKKMLNAAALTYVAATASAVSQLIRLIVLRNSRRDDS